MNLIKVRSGTRWNRLRLFRAVTAARLFSAVDPQRIEGSTDDLIAYTGQVANASAANQHDGVFLKVVSFTGNIDGDFFAVAESDAGDFPESRIRLLGGHRSNDQADPFFLGASLENGALRGTALDDAIATDQLIDGWHTFLY